MRNSDFGHSLIVGAPSLVIVLHVAAVGAQEISLRPYPPAPYSIGECEAVHRPNNESISQFHAALYRQAEQYINRPNCSTCNGEALRLMNRADREQRRAFEVDSRGNDQCREQAYAYERRQREQERAQQQQQAEAEARARQQQAEARRQQQTAETQARQNRGTTLDQTNTYNAYEKAKQGYADAKQLYNAVQNPGQFIRDRAYDAALGSTRETLRGSAPPSHPEYDAYHNTAKNYADKVTRNEGVKVIQDSMLDELKSRNNQTLSQIDDLDRQIAELNQSMVSGRGSQVSPQTGTLRVPSGASDDRATQPNPWAASGLPATTTASTGNSPSRQSSRNVSTGAANPWADDAGSSGDGSTKIATAAPSNPWADNPSTNSKTTSYTDPHSGTTYSIKPGYTLYRDPTTKKLTVVKVSAAKQSGDAVDGVSCSYDGLGVVTPACEQKRRGG